MSIPKQATLVEVGPRDGLQNISDIIPTEHKISLIEKLIKTGLPVIEIGGFVSSKKVPQLEDSDKIVTHFASHNAVRFPVLVPNMEGLEAAMTAGAKEIAVFGSATDAFSLKNINCTIDESFARFIPVIKKAQDHKIRVRAYISCVMGCPYSGTVSPAQVFDVAKRFHQLGVHEISLGDTIGTGSVGDADKLLNCLKRSIPVNQLAVHFHNTYGQALANIYVALEHGISIIDSSIGGLGGCPFAKTATGNVATEDVLYMLDSLGIKTNVKMKDLIKAHLFIKNLLNTKLPSAVGNAFASVTINK
jgi:hydroxymethylglutaryl-CoA lyase